MSAVLFMQESPGVYAPARPVDIRHAAMQLAEDAMRREPLTCSDPSTVRNWLIARFAECEREEFVVLWLDSQHRLIEAETVSTGTINAASVHPREVVRTAIRLNAAAAVLAHNHPSGIAEPSMADRTLTTRLRDTLAMIDCRVQDHFVIAGSAGVSFAERGWL